MPMNQLPLHPAIVHLPLALAVVVPIVGLALLVALWRQWLPGRSAWLAVGLQALLVGTGFVAMQTGEADEERVERLVGEAALEAHEEAASAFVWAGAGVLGAGLLSLLMLRGSRGPLAATAITTAGAFVVLGLAYRAGEAGGALVYRHGAAAAFAGVDAAGQPTSGLPQTRNRDRDDDDDR